MFVIHLWAGWFVHVLEVLMEKINVEKTAEKVGAYCCALFCATVQSSSVCKWKFISYCTVTVERDKAHIPALLWVLMPKGQDVRGTTAAVTHHHGHRRSVSQVLKHDRDHIRTPLQYQSHHWNTLSDPCGENRNVSEKVCMCAAAGLLVTRKTNQKD